MQEHDKEQKSLLLERIVESLTDAVTVFDAQGHVMYANDTAAHMAGLTYAEELMQMPREKVVELNIIYDKDHNKIPTELYASRQAATGKGVHDRVILQINKADHKQRWLSITSAPLYNEAGEVEYIVTRAKDITARKSEEDKLNFLIASVKILSLTEDLKERLRQKAQFAVPALADWCAIDLVDEAGTITREVLVHRDPEKLKFVEEFQKKYPPDPNAPSAVRAVIESGEPQYMEHISDEALKASAKREGEYDAALKLELSSAMILPIKSRGKMLGTLSMAYAESGRTYSPEDFQFMQEYCHHIGVVLDNARLYKELNESDKAKDIFLARLSHELRNPLAPITSSLELLSIKNHHPELEDELVIIERQFKHMTKLLNDLMDVTRSVHGKMQLQKTIVDLRTLINDTMRSNEAFVTHKKIDFKVSLPDEPLIAEVDTTRIEQAITNLLHNAEKFTPSGGRIFVDVSRVGDEVEISVLDNGIGIARENLEKIFSVHFQVIRKTRRSGLGIGLVLVNEIINEHGGSVKAYSEGVGQGSEFVVRLPLVPKDLEPQKNNSNTLITSPYVKGVARKILVVDDNYDAADTLVRLLNALGADARAVYSGQETLLYLEHSKPDAFILDIGMPGMDGYELVRILRSLGFTKTPIIALTGYGLKEEKQKVLKAGFDKHLTKPVGAEELKSLLKRPKN